MRKEDEANALLRLWSSLRRESMQSPEDVAVMLRLHQLGWGFRKIARELGVDRNTVRKHVRAGGWKPYKQPRRAKTLDGLEAWLEAEFRKHRGNADVVHQELERVHGIEVSLRTVERAVRPFRQALENEAKATVRFETPPGRQMQCDFGQTRVHIGGEVVRVHLCVMTLGFSRRMYVVAHARERQANWLGSFEAAFAWFGGIPSELLVDNARALVAHHDAATREVEFNGTFAAFCRHWGVTPKACAPYRARTKGKDERAVGYVKRNAIAGREFESWDHLQRHLDRWCREVADVRVHGTTGEPPITRFDQREAEALQPLGHRVAFQRPREVVRKVGTDFCVELDTNRYSVPWRFIGERVTVLTNGQDIEVRRAGQVIARHPRSRGRREWFVAREHLEGVVVGRPARVQAAATAPEPPPPQAEETGELLRPLTEYAAIAGGAW